MLGTSAKAGAIGVGNSNRTKFTGEMIKCTQSCVRKRMCAGKVFIPMLVSMRLPTST